MNKLDTALSSHRQGNQHFAAGEYERAIQCYLQAIESRPDFTDAYYNLGLAYLRIQKRLEAVAAYQAVIALDPAHLGGRFQLGCISMQHKRYAEAVSHFKVIENHYPEHIETLVNLGACYFLSGDLAQAKNYYQRALEISPEELQALYNLGVISAQLGRSKQAMEYYLQVVKLAPNYFDAHNNLAVLYLNNGDAASALLHFQTALHIQPDNEAVRHSIEALQQTGKTTSTPASYVRSLFDSYADHYDAHMQQTLAYQVPEHLFDLIKDKLHANAWQILDLGCGTGLCAPMFKPYAATLTGIDISANMLAQAAKKELYSRLVEADALIFLNQIHQQFDLIVAADVMVYFGDLAPLLQAMAQASHRDGYLLFNTELTTATDYILQANGRFAHAQAYVRHIAETSGWRFCGSSRDMLRKDRDIEVIGEFYLFKR